MSVKARMSVHNLIDHPSPSSSSSSSSASHAKSSSATGKTKLHVCNVCMRAFNKREHLKRHKLLVHEERRPYVCRTCDLRFGTKQNMQVHLTTRKHRQRESFLAHSSSGRGSI